jgi:hypothetical protein
MKAMHGSYSGRTLVYKTSYKSIYQGYFNSLAYKTVRPGQSGQNLHVYIRLCLCVFFVFDQMTCNQSIDNNPRAIAMKARQRLDKAGKKTTTKKKENRTDARQGWEVFFSKG